MSLKSSEARLSKWTTSAYWLYMTDPETPLNNAQQSGH